MSIKTINYSSSYSFRSSTLHATTASIARHPNTSKKKRTILPLTETPSLTANVLDIRTIDPEKSAMKSYLRVQNYWIDAVIEKVVHTQFFRGKTNLQGSQAPMGWQAAHFSLAPHTVDSLTEDVITSVIDKGLTPTRSQPFLRARIELSSPDGKILQQNHTDPTFVRDYVLSKLPSGADDSSLYGTRFSLARNATFENPNESNQFDSLLEIAIKPLLNDLQTQRSLGTIDENAATQQIVEWLIHYYKTSIANNQQRLDQLKAFLAIQHRLSLFEDNYSATYEIPPEKFQEYITTAQQLLECKSYLLTPLEGTSRCHGINLVRNDYYYLCVLVKNSNNGTSFSTLENFFYANTRHFANRPKICEETLRKKYEFFIQEANAQLDGVLTFAAPCTISALKTALFGVCIDGVRMPPTEDELREQIFSIFKLATPYKSKTRTRIFNKDTGGTLPRTLFPDCGEERTDAAKRLRMEDFVSSDEFI